MTKFLNFTVAETSGRTFEVPMDKVEELIEQYKRNMFEDTGLIPDVDTTDDYEIAKILKDYFLDDISEDEKGNDYYELTLSSSKFMGED